MNKIHCMQFDNLFDWNKLFSISPHDIKWGLSTGFDITKNEWCKVWDGDWDKKIPIIEDFVNLSVIAMIKDGIGFTDTSLYQASIKKILEGQNRWDCNNIEDFKKRGQHILKIYENIKNNGYKTQEELEGFTVNNIFIDEPGIAIDRDGRYLYHNGNHRLPMFKILNIPEIKIRVNVRHKIWADFLNHVGAICKNIWGENKTYQPVGHVDFANFESEWSNYRSYLIKPHLDRSCKTLLDIGALWGHFSSFFSKEGLCCVAVESNKDFSYIMNKLRISQDLSYKIICDSIFNIQTYNYDVVLALNIFHHFLKKKNTFIQLTELLSKLKMKELYFQPHRTEEAQMLNSYENFNNDTFVNYILDNSCLNKAKEIGEENGRKIYKMWVDK